ncbi:MAG: hypothetical protein FWB74_09935 [Defluviitaleaceae bacterium]|nr:hypothetical protein [Defluviitaleaceae bacterium]
MKLRKEHKMAIFKALLDTVFKYFCVVVTVLITVSWGRTWLNDGTWVLHSQDLMRILLVSFFGVFPNVMVEVFIETDSAKGARQKNIVRFGITALLVLGIDALIEQTYTGAPLGTVTTFLLVYIGISVYSYFNAINIELKEKKLAEDINERLNEIHKDENESH